MTTQEGTKWVFGYGSLIWRPGFAYLHAEPARLDGYHRQLCVRSHKYRGTVERNGLVFGLAQGGFCQGLAYEVSEDVWAETHAYLRDRELVTEVYLEKLLPVQLGKRGNQVNAMTYVVDVAHRQYAGLLNQKEVLNFVRQGHGEAGSCADYVRQTAEHLAAHGIADAELDALAQLI